MSKGGEHQVRSKTAMQRCPTCHVHTYGSCRPASLLTAASALSHGKGRRSLWHFVPAR